MAFISACCLWVYAGHTKTPWPVIALLNACFMSCPGRIVELWSSLFQQHFHYLLQSLFPSLSARSEARKRSEMMFTVLSAWKVHPDRRFRAVGLFCPLFIPSLLPCFGRLLLRHHKTQISDMTVSSVSYGPRWVSAGVLLLRSNRK